MSSVILSEPLDVSKYSLIYAGAQKNIGPAGLTMVIVDKNYMEEEDDTLPNILRYSKHSQAGSMLNTPPTFAWYMAGKVFKWIKKSGGLNFFKEQNHKKASSLYDFIDSSSFYSNPVKVENRSIMNIPFILADKSLDTVFLKEAEENGLLNLKGHRSVGGMRASIYNAMPLEGVNQLIDFMKVFEAKYG
jgi:phosphoserine aminotransferase